MIKFRSSKDIIKNNSKLFLMSFILLNLSNILVFQIENMIGTQFVMLIKKDSLRNVNLMNELTKALISFCKLFNKNFTIFEF